MVFDRADIAIRLVEERTRVGYTQRDLAEKLGITPETLRRYEIGQSRLDAEFLAKSAGYGIDVQYVLTGIKSPNRDDVEKATAPKASVENSNNVVMFAQSGSNITQINTHKHVTRTVAKTEPGVAHITEQQAAKLTALVKSVVDLEQVTKRNPKSHRAVWAALNAHCGAASYRLIALENFGKAETYLYNWIGRLNSGATAKKSDNAAWRNRKYAYIKVNTKDPEDQVWLQAKLGKDFGVSSLTELSDEELERLYKQIASKRARNKKGR